MHLDSQRSSSCCWEGVLCLHSSALGLGNGLLLFRGVRSFQMAFMMHKRFACGVGVVLFCCRGHSPYTLNLNLYTHYPTVCFVLRKSSRRSSGSSNRPRAISGVSEVV